MLEDILVIIEERRKQLVESGSTNISEHNCKTGSNLQRIIVACDEVAEVLDNTGLEKEEKSLIAQIESKFSTIARQGRAFGIHGARIKIVQIEMRKSKINKNMVR